MASLFYCSASLLGSNRSQTSEDIPAIHFDNSPVSIPVEKFLLLSKQMLLDFIQELHWNFNLEIYNALNHELLLEHVDKFLSQPNVKTTIIEVTDRDNFFRQILMFSRASKILLISALDAPESGSEFESYIILLTRQAQAQFINAIDALTKYDQTAEISFKGVMLRAESVKEELTKHVERLAQKHSNSFPFNTSLEEFAKISIAIIDQMQFFKTTTNRPKLRAKMLLTIGWSIVNAVHRGNIALRIILTNYLVWGADIFEIMTTVDEIKQLLEERKQLGMETTHRNDENRIKIFNLYEDILDKLSTCLHRERNRNPLAVANNFTDLQKIARTPLPIEKRQLFYRADKVSANIALEGVIPVLQAARAYFEEYISNIEEVASIPHKSSSTRNLSNILYRYFLNDILLDKLAPFNIKLSIGILASIIKECEAFLKHVYKYRNDFDKCLQEPLIDISEEEYQKIIELFGEIDAVFGTLFEAVRKTMKIGSMVHIDVCQERLTKYKTSLESEMSKAKPGKLTAIATLFNVENSRAKYSEEKKKYEFVEMLHDVTVVTSALVSQLDIMARDAIIQHVLLALLAQDFTSISNKLLDIIKILSRLTDEQISQLSPHQLSITAECKKVPIDELSKEYRNLPNAGKNNLKNQWLLYFNKFNQRILNLISLLSEMITALPEEYQKMK